MKIITGFKVKNIGGYRRGGVASTVPVQTILPGDREKRIAIHGEGRQSILTNGTTRKWLFHKNCLGLKKAA